MDTLIFGFSIFPNKVKNETIGKIMEEYKKKLYVFLSLKILCQGGFIIKANTNIIEITRQNLLITSIILAFLRWSSWLYMTTVILFYLKYIDFFLQFIWPL